MIQNSRQAAWSGIGGNRLPVLTYVVRSEARVDEVMAEAEKAGAAILKPAGALPWGGYGGTFADPDGYIWSLGYSEQAKDQPYAE